MPHLWFSRRALIGVASFGLPACLAPSARAGDDAANSKGGDKMSGSEISWVFSMTVKDGAGDGLKAMISEMSEHTRASEPGALGYEWSISDDGARAQVHERYRDSDAAMVHSASFNQNFAARLMKLVDPAGMVVFGEPSAALKEALEGANPVYMRPAGGFVR